jgi:hypothetical protein
VDRFRQVLHFTHANVPFMFSRKQNDTLHRRRIVPHHCIASGKPIEVGAWQVVKVVVQLRADVVGLYLERVVIATRDVTI